MRGIVSRLHIFGQFLTGIFEVRLPISVWLDFATLELLRTRR